MFPLRDENPTELTPWVTALLIAANVVAWLYLQGAGFEQRELYESVCRFGLVPAELTGAPREAPDGPLVCPEGAGGWAGMLTSIFMHGSWLHLLGNMWFLWLFGNNVEDSMGHGRFLAFYLLTGIVAGAAHIFSAPASVVPTVGASGAISGVMGAYLVLFPRVRIHTLFILVFLVRVFPIPAWVVLLQWFAIQLLYGTAGSQIDAGVAFWAHIGGFVAGLLLVKPLAGR